jgi:DNA-binding MarR family transcriptional regulator
MNVIPEHLDKGVYALNISAYTLVVQDNSMQRARGSPQECNCLAVRQAARHVTQLYDQCLAPYGVRASQLALLSILHRSGPLTINEMAAALAMDRTTLGRNLRPLERDGLIEVAVAAADRRRRDLRLSSAGKERFTRALAGWAKAQDRFDETFGAGRATQFRTLMHDVTATPFGRD